MKLLQKITFNIKFTPAEGLQRSPTKNLTLKAMS